MAAMQGGFLANLGKVYGIYTGGFFARYEINENIEAYGNFMFSDYRSVAQIAPSGAFFVTSTIQCQDPDTGAPHPLLSDQQFAERRDLLNGNRDVRIRRRFALGTSLNERELEVDEVSGDLWQRRAAEAGVPLETFYEVAESLNRRGVIGRFSTFLEHVKPLQSGDRVKRFNALFNWAGPPGRAMRGPTGAPSTPASTARSAGVATRRSPASSPSAPRSSRRRGSSPSTGWPDGRRTTRLSATTLTAPWCRVWRSRAAPSATACRSRSARHWG